MPFLGDLVQEGRISVVEQRFALAGVLQRAVVHLQLGDRTTLGVIPGPTESRLIGHLVRRGSPTISVTEDAEEERTAPIHLVKTDLKGGTFFGFLLGDTPPEIHIVETDPSLLASIPQLGEHITRQPVSLTVHVPEGGRHEQASGPPATGPHLSEFLCSLLSLLLFDEQLVFFLDLLLLLLKGFLGVPVIEIQNSGGLFLSRLLRVEETQLLLSER